MPTVVNLPTDEKPPKARAKQTTTEPPKTGPTPHTPDEKKLAISIASGYGAIGMGVVGLGMRMGDLGLQGTGLEIVNQADAVSSAWVDLSRKNPKVKAYLKKITEVSAAGVVIGIHVSMLIPILASRGVLPAGMAGMTEPQEDFDPNTNGHGGNTNVPL